MAEVAILRPDGTEAGLAAVAVSGDPVLVPPERSRLVVRPVSGTTVQTDTFYVDPQGSLSYPAGIKHVTVTGAKSLPWGVLGWHDVWIEGKPDALINVGPQVGSDLLQVKNRVPAGAPSGTPPQIPTDVTVRWARFHDLTREDGSHSDGIQHYCGVRVRFIDCQFHQCSTQPVFYRDGGASTGGGPIEDCLLLRCVFTGSVENFYTVRISGDKEAASGGHVPTRVKVVDCVGDRNVSIDQAARNRGCETINYVRT